ncbi:MAG: cob(I)yrinic acid a,c-diamide adenosyltransferase [Trueperaceae bacterium]
MKIYTRTGDEGSTALFGGRRVPKDDLRVSAYGTVDEANALLGLARAELAREAAGGADAALDEELAQLQSLLFDLGADLATPDEARQRGFIRPVDQQDVDAVEELIDRYSAELPELRQFILPGGSAASAALQTARAVLRRAEREVVALARSEQVGEHVVPLVNRLSDLFFTLARLVNVRSGTPEVPWTARRPQRGELP